MNKTQAINYARLLENGRALGLDQSDINTLRRCEMTLHRWGELECGDGNDYASWAIERDEASGKPYLVTYPHTGDVRRQPIADRERGALRRVAAICERAGLHYFHQGDPRGCALYISRNKMEGATYTQGLAVHIGH